MTHYIPSNAKHEKEILDTLNISSFEELISIIPKSLRIKDGILGLEPGISEHELDLFIKSINDNNSLIEKVCFSGGGGRSPRGMPYTYSRKKSPNPG